jgi:hypothetical protein
MDLDFPHHGLPTHHLSSLGGGLVSDDDDDEVLLFHRRGGGGGRGGGGEEGGGHEGLGFGRSETAVYYGEGTDALHAVREHNFAVHLRHSPVYFAFNVLMVVLTAFLVAYVVFSQDHTPRDSLFFVLEVVVTIAVVIDLAVEVSYFGAQDYFSIRAAARANGGGGGSGGGGNVDGDGGRGSGAEVAGESFGTGSVVRCMSHWFQLAVTILCVLALVVYAAVPDIPATAARYRRIHAHGKDGWRVVKKTDLRAESKLSAADQDNLVSLFLLLLRYLVYVIFLVTSSSRSMHVQGCFDEKVEWEVAEASDRESGWWD